jgi:hypothetical protein
MTPNYVYEITTCEITPHYVVASSFSEAFEYAQRVITNYPIDGIKQLGRVEGGLPHTV